MAMNNFSNDGSFLERFRSMQQRKDPPQSTTSDADSELQKQIKTEPSESESEDSTAADKKPSQTFSLANDGRFLARFKQMQKRASLTSKNSPATNGSCLSPSIFKRELLDTTDTKTGSHFGDDGEETDHAELDPKTRVIIENLAEEIRAKGTKVEEEAQVKYKDNPAYWFLRDKDSSAYKFFKQVSQSRVKVEANSTCGESLCTVSAPIDCASVGPRNKKRKSRWDVGDNGNKIAAVAPSVLLSTDFLTVNAPPPVIPAAAGFDYDPLQMSVADSRKQILEQAQLRIMQQRIEAKRAAMKAREQAVLMGKSKPIFDYDSDEDAEDGTWEHKLRRMEMDKTKDQADKLTTDSDGKHHIGQFLPSAELEKFMTAFKAAKEGQVLDKSDYQEAKLTEENKGFKLLQKMGWTEGKGLGASEQGVTVPINKGRVTTDNEGLGASSSNDISGEEDAYDLYRKRMMLGYRFRPNPLNNPRRQYY